MSRLFVLLAFACGAQFATAAEYVLTLPGCEYTVTLPVEPVVATGRPSFGSATGPSMVATIKGRIPAYRVECQGFRSLPPNARSAMLDDMHEQTERMNLRDLQRSSERTRLGTVGEYTGIDVQAGYRFVVTGRNLLGSNSVMSIVVTEPVTSYPSEETTRVLRSIRR